jgi:hypothetical protein
LKVAETSEIFEFELGDHAGRLGKGDGFESFGKWRLGDKGAFFFAGAGSTERFADFLHFGGLGAGEASYVFGGSDEDGGGGGVRVGGGHA